MRPTERRLERFSRSRRGVYAHAIVVPSEVQQVHGVIARVSDSDQMQYPGGVQVVGIYQGEVGAVPENNQLLKPFTLEDLNRFMGWYQLFLRYRTTLLQLDSDVDLFLDVTAKVQIPHYQREHDSAYGAWLEKHPGGTLTDWIAYTSGRISSGVVECQIHSCEDFAVVGKNCCEKHSLV